jgi:hypothetical protein
MSADMPPPALAEVAADHATGRCGPDTGSEDAPRADGLPACERPALVGAADGPPAEPHALTAPTPTVPTAANPTAALKQRRRDFNKLCTGPTLSTSMVERIGAREKSFATVDGRRQGP